MGRLTGLAGESFTSEAQKLNKEVLSSKWFNRAEVIPGLGSVSELVTELLRRKPGEMGVWKRNPILGHVIYRLSKTKKPDHSSFCRRKGGCGNCCTSERSQINGY